MQTSRMPAAAIAAGPLFVAVFLAEGALRADYDPLRHPVSSLAIGPDGWVQNVNFLVTGALVLAAAAGLRAAVPDGVGHRALPILVALVGFGLIGAGLATCDPIGGYPPGTPAMPLVRTVHGVVHDICSTPVFTALPATGAVAGVRWLRAGRRAWAIGAFAAGAAMLVAFVLTSIGFAQDPVLGPVAGLLQRITLVIGFAWLAVLAVLARRARALR